MKKLAAFGLLLVFVLLVAGNVLYGWMSAGPADRPVSVVIAQGSSLRKAATTLEDTGVLTSADRFLLLAKIFGGSRSIQAGEYEIPAKASASQVMSLLQSGRTLQRFITIPEGLPSILVQERLMNASALTGTVGTPAEGSVLPDSYSYQRGESREAILRRMQAAMVKELDALWATRQPHSVVSSKVEAIILASIVEKETGKPSERRMVAGVYGNRVRQGMKLDADPTVIYPITKGKPLGRRIRRSELNANNGYNTYARAGLPIGPIANPGRMSIAAVLNPARTEALFFVADGTGGHIFANSLAEHNANVAKWYAIRRARGEM